MSWRKFPLAAVAVALCVTGYLGLSSEEETKSAGGVSVTFFYTGELLGELEPCGCSGEKTGGMSLRSSWINFAKGQYPHLCLVDGGFASPQDNRQSQIKFDYYYRMLCRLGYHCCFLHEAEKISAHALDSSTTLLGRDAGRWSYSRQIVTEGRPWKILFLAIEPDHPQAEIKKLLESSSPDAIFIMTRGIYQNYDSLVPCANCPVIMLLADAQEPFSPVLPREGLFVVSAGNRGRYAGIFQLTLDQDRRITWNNRIVPLKKGHPVDQNVVNLLGEYQKQVKDEMLLSQEIKQSSPVGFVGSETCRICHEYEYRLWSTKAHARAFATLVRENYHYDPECVGCHVVGYEYEEGFRDAEDTPHLVNVGCESCHGPGAEHSVTANAAYGKTDGAKTCIFCHAPDRSPRFEYSSYREKIKHWRD